MTTPRHRPPLAVRAFVAVLAAGVVAFNAALMLSDSAPGFLRRLSDRIDAGGQRDRIASDPRFPESDTLVHIVVWAVAIVLVGLAVWTWRGLAIGAAGVLALSIVIELAQGQFTDTRVVQVGDMAANAVGVVLGSSVVAACYLLWSAMARRRAVHH